MTDWTRYRGGRGWRQLNDGRLVLEHGLERLPNRRYLELDDDGAVRTRGEPASMRTLRDEHGHPIAQAACRFGVPEHVIAATIAVEAARMSGRAFSYDPISLRHEPGYESDQATPHRVSAGLMQTLLSTAREVAAEHGIVVSFWGVEESVKVGDLCVPHRSITLGAAYLQMQAEHYGDDPILMIAAYNAGGLYPTSRNEWNLRTYGEARIPKFAAYHNDWLALDDLRRGGE